MDSDNHDWHIGRRRFLQATAGVAAGLVLGDQAGAAPAYRVGVGNSSDPYAATERAIQASGQWPASAIAGKTVIIKPNLVIPAAASTGLTTDPQVVRAVVDRALAAGAARVQIVEYRGATDKWGLSGYSFFSDYDSRVSLVDLGSQPLSFVKVPRGMAYLSVYLPSMLVAANTVFMSVAKLKTHGNAVASLAMKNLFGLPPIAPYQNSSIQGRFAMHDRSVAQAVVDLNLARPIHFAVVDGIWGMEGEGPLAGQPVSMNLVVSGRNAVAVDRVCLRAMDIPEASVQHLDYAARKRLGPTSLAEVEVAGDALAPRAFVRATAQPIIEYPQPNPVGIVPSTGQTTQITYSLDAPALTRVEILRTDDRRAAIQIVRTLQSWRQTQAGAQQIVWDGRDASGNILPVGWYVIRVQATFAANVGAACATGRVWITG